MPAFKRTAIAFVQRQRESVTTVPESSMCICACFFNLVWTPEIGKVFEVGALPSVCLFRSLLATTTTPFSVINYIPSSLIMPVSPFCLNQVP